MTFSITHAKVTTIPDAGDASLVEPSDWNAGHVIALATGKLIGRTTAGSGAAEEIGVDASLSLSAGTLSVAAGGVTNAMLANSSITLNAGSGVGLTAPGSVSLGGTATIGATTDAVQLGTLALGTTIGTTTLAVAGSVADVNQNKVINLAPILNFTTGSGITQFGLLNSTSTVVSGGSNLTAITAFYQNTISVSGSSTLALGIGFRARITLAGASPSGTISNSATGEIAAPANQTSGTPSLTISSHKGLYVRNQGISGTGLTVTESHGIYVDAQSGSTANYALWYNSASPTILFSSGGFNCGQNADPTVGVINALNKYTVAATQVVGPRVTGYTAMTGSPDKATAYATGTVTLAQLAGRVAQLQADLTTHGLIGA